MSGKTLFLKQTEREYKMRVKRRSLSQFEFLFREAKMVKILFLTVILAIGAANVHAEDDPLPLIEPQIFNQIVGEVV